MVRSGLITFLAVVITTRPYASAEEITFTFDAEMRINGALGDFEEGDEFTITYTFESSTPPSGTPGTGQSVSYVSAITSWEVEFPTRGYVFRGTDGRIVVQHDPPTRDRYMVYLNVPETEYVLPSGRRVSRLWIDCGDPAVRGPVDMLADDSIQTTKPDLSLAAYSAGKIYMHNEDGTNTTPAEFYVLYNTPPTANAGPGQEVELDVFAPEPSAADRCAVGTVSTDRWAVRSEHLAHGLVELDRREVRAKHLACQLVELDRWEVPASRSRTLGGQDPTAVATRASSSRSCERPTTIAPFGPGGTATWTAQPDGRPT